MALAALIACHPPPASAGKLRKVWEVDLRTIVKASNGNPGFPVYALRFSLDGRKLAVIADAYKTQDGLKSRLMVLDLDRPGTYVPQFEVEFGVLDGGVQQKLGWTPSGQIVYALGTVIHLSTGKTCQLPSPSIFVSDAVAVSVQPVTTLGHTQIAFYGPGCEVQDLWDVGESWLASDVSTDRHLLSILKPGDSASVGGEGLIVDPLMRRVLQRWDLNGGGPWRFADAGKVVCHGANVRNATHAPATCRDVDTGKGADATRRNGSDPLVTSAHATRIVVSDFRRSLVPFGSDEFDLRFKGLYVWDFAAGKEIASWYPKSETYQNVFKPDKYTTSQFRFAMSPDGKYVAEGGSGAVSLYKLEP